mgnify:CR=1 FL=1
MPILRGCLKVRHRVLLLCLILKISEDLVELKEKILTKRAKIGVIGLGYVGLPLAVEFSKAGFDVTGFDVDQSKVQEVMWLY